MPNAVDKIAVFTTFDFLFFLISETLFASFTFSFLLSFEFFIIAP